MTPGKQAGTNPAGVAVNPNTNRIYVTNYADDTVSVIQDFPIPILVGGIAEYSPLEPHALAGGHGSSGPNSIALAGFAAGGGLLLASGAWYARRRRRAG